MIARILKISVLILAVCALPACSGADYVQLGGYAQGGVWSVKYPASQAHGGDSKVRPREVQKHIEGILQQIDTTLSGYNKKSQLSRFNAGERIRPCEMFTSMYEMSHRIWRETEGAVDCAAGPLYDAWGFGFSTDSLPSAETVGELLAHCGMARLDSTVHCAPDGTLAGADLCQEGGVRLNFNAVAQGYSADLVAGYLESLGVSDYLVDIGEIVCKGHNASGKPWGVGIDRPVDGNNTPGADIAGIWLSDPDALSQGIVTSGNYRKFYIRGGRKFSHTIDPRTGYPVGMEPGAEPGQETLLSATIVASNGFLADAYATCCMVLGYKKARALISSRPDLEGYLIYSSPDGTMSFWESEGFILK